MAPQVFISYAREDQGWLDKVQLFCSPAVDKGQISFIADRNISSGEDWRESLDQFLASADAAILLVSADFFNSPFIKTRELPYLLEAASQRKLKLFPVAVGACLHELTKLEPKQFVNDPAKPLKNLLHEELDQALIQICRRILDELVEDGDEDGETIPPCPYPGLRPFDESQVKYFHGREKEKMKLREAVESRHLIMVLGPSGSGKSSLVFAGLLPELKERASPPRPWEVLTLRPQQTPATNLNRRFPGVLEQPEEAVTRYLASRQGASRLLLIFDQFEECFTQVAKEEQEKLFAIIQGLRRVEMCTVVLTLRAVFLEDLMLSKLWPAGESDPIERIEITPLQGDNMREAIVKPAATAGVTIDPGLVELLLADAAGEPGRLPLLQTTLEFLWDKLQKRKLPLEAYKQLGEEGRQRVAYALGRKADEALDSLSADEQTIARPFLRLIQFVEGRPETRRQQPLSALHDGAETQILVERMVNSLAGHGLLVVDRQGDENLVDLAHEALITAWPTLRDWIARWREPEQERRRWETKAAEWLDCHREEDLLLEKEPLRRLEKWLESPGAASVGYSRALDEFAQASRRALVGIWGRSRAEELARQAEAQLERDPDLALRLAMEAVSMIWRQGQPPVAQAEDALRLALVHTPVRRILHDHQGEVLGMAVSRDGRLLATTGADGTAKVWDVASGQLKVSTKGHVGPVYGTAFDPGGTCFATAGGDSTVRIWSLSDGQQLSTLTGHQGIATCVAYSPRGNFLVSAGGDATARIWDLSAKEVHLELRGHRRPIRTVAFNANGTRVATAGDDAIVRIWNAVSGEEALALLGHVNRVWNVAWESPFSLATAGEDRTVRIWDAMNGFLRLTRQRHKRPVRSVDFDSSGGLLTASEDGMVRIWGTRGGEVEVVRTLRSPGARLVGAAHGQSETESFVLATGADGTTRLWRTADGQEIVAHRFDDVCRLGDAMFSPAGLRTLLLAPGNDSSSAVDGGYAQVRNIESGEVVTTLQERTRRPAMAEQSVDTGTIQAPVPSHASGINHAEYSPDGRFLATASRDQTARIWDASSGQEVVILEGHTRPVRRVSWSSDGLSVVTASEDHTARIWEAETGRPLQLLEGHAGNVYAAVFSPPDGLRIATASADGTTRIWDRATGKLLHILREPRASVVNDVVWSPDGLWVATASRDGTARIWNWAEGKSQHVLRGHEGSVFEIAWSPDGSTLATAGKDRTVRLWNAATGERRSTLRGHTAEVVGVIFSPDGKRVISTGNDRTIRQYLADVEDLLKEAAARNPRELTPEERADYLGETATTPSAA